MVTYFWIPAFAGMTVYGHGYEKDGLQETSLDSRLRGNDSKKARDDNKKAQGGEKGGF